MRQQQVKWVFNITLCIWVSLIAMTVHAVEKKASADDNVALVNGVAITRAEFDKEFGLFEKQMSAQGQAIPEARLLELKSRIINSLIDQELLSQECKKHDIQVEQAVIDASVSELRDKFNSDEDFIHALKEMNLTRDNLQLKIKQNMAAKKLIETQVKNTAEIPEKESRAFYDAHPDYFQTPEQVKVSHMLIKVAADADDQTKTKAREMMEKIVKQIKKGGDFSEIAKEYSESDIKPEGGEMDYFSRGQLMKPIEDAAFALKSGEVSDIINTEHGLHVLKLTDKKPEGVMAYAEVKGKISEFLKQKNMKEKVDAYLEGLRRSAKIEKMM